MTKARKVYIDVTTGKYYALFLGEHVKSFLIEDSFPSGLIRIEHGEDTTAIIPRLYTNENEELLPPNFKIIDNDTVELNFVEPFTGKIKLLFFNT